MANADHFDELAHQLSLSDNYKVLRRIQPRRQMLPQDGSETRRGLFVDVETTGLDFDRDEVIELAMVPFTFGRDGRIFQVLEPFQGYREPSRSIPKAVTKLTGIAVEAVRGRELDQHSIDSMLSVSDLVVAHNADFDRKFVERVTPFAGQRRWACSMTDIDWRAEGFESTKLEYLALKSGLFFAGHRAVNDCLAGIELLAMPLESTGEPALAQLLSKVVEENIQIVVNDAPFSANQVLKERGYRFSRSANAKALWKHIVKASALEGEESFLDSMRLTNRKMERVSRFDRFSSRTR